MWTRSSGSTYAALEFRAHVLRQMHAAIDITLGGHRGPAAELGLRVLRGDAATLAADARVLAILGPFRSGDTAAAGRPLNTALHLYPRRTRMSRSPAGLLFAPDEPERDHPHGPRTYVRLFPTDFHQAAALVQVAMSLGVQRPFVLRRRALRSDDLRRIQPRRTAAGLKLAGIGPSASIPVEQVARVGADALVLCGVLDEHVHHVIREKVRILGPNHRGQVAWCRCIPY